MSPVVISLLPQRQAAAGIVFPFSAEKQEHTNTDCQSRLIEVEASLVSNSTRCGTQPNAPSVSQNTTAISNSRLY